MPKGIFIGIGGTGVTTVARLKALLFQRAYSSNKAAMDADCTFVFYDTDGGAKDKALADIELQRMMGQYPVIDLAPEFIDAGPTAPYNLYQYAKNAPMSDKVSQRMLEWAIDPDVPDHFKLPQKQLSEGAGAQRMAGRCGFMYKRSEFEAKIQTGINKLGEYGNNVNQLSQDHPAIWVFSSSNGGTSSSALLDVLYLVDRLYKRHVADVNPYLRLVLYMPKVFIDKNEKNSLNYTTNSYATLWELNEFRNDAVLNNDGRKFGSFAALPDRKEWNRLTPWQVCSYVMAVDIESLQGRVSLEQMFNNTAEMCYFLHTGAGGQTMISNLDNDFSTGGPYYGQFTTSQTDQFKWSQFLVGSGYRAITKADDFLKDYVRKRFRYDFYGFGLLGLSYEKILTTPEEQREAAISFANEYILNYLINLDKFDNSPKDSLWGQYVKSFESIEIPYENEVPSKDEWNNMGAVFKTECKSKAKSIRIAFDSPNESSLSMSGWIHKIEESVKKGIDECVENYGLNYTSSLLARVDDEYCEKEVIGKLLQRNNLNSLETDIDDIIQNNKPKKGITELVAKMNEYKQACVYELAIEHIKAIIQNITQEKVGLLEIIRKGDQNHTGINGLIKTFNNNFNTSKTAYQELASSFKKTESEVCSDYFPHVCDFVKDGDVWDRCNRFEILYSSIVPLNMDEGANTFESLSFGCPPIRPGDKGLSSIINLIKNRVLNHTYMFADMALSNPMTQFSGLLQDFTREIGRFIESAMESSNYDVKQWLDLPLDRVFDEHFTKDGVLDATAQQQYVTQFTNSIPVFYPISLGAMPGVTNRWLYVGATPKFAGTMGYTQNNEKQYVPDPSLGHRFLVCKLAVGHSFYEYKYFDMLNDLYTSNIRVIEQEGSGCHIHRDFVYRNINSAFEQRKTKKFNDFISLCWYDSFFEYLNSMQDKT